MTSQLRSKNITLTVILVVCVFTFPVFKTSLPNNQGYFILMFLQLALSGAIIYSKHHPVFWPVLISFLISVHIVVTIAFSVSPTTRDLFEAIRPVLYSSAFIVGYYADVKSKINIIKLSYTTLSTVIGVLLINQVFKISPGLAGLYSSLDFFYFNRFSAIFSNPYDLAFALSFIISITTTKMIVNGPKLITIVIFIGSFIAVVLSQSRTGLISCTLALLLLFLCTLYRKKRKEFRILIALPILSLLLIFYSIYTGWLLKFEYLINGILAVIEGRSVHSMTIRFEQIEQVWADFSIIGHGPGFGIAEVFLESQYALYSYRYGLVGIAFLMFIIVFTLVTAIPIALRTRNTYLLGSAVWILITPVLFFTNAYMDIARTSFLYFIILGSICRTKTRVIENV